MSHPTLEAGQTYSGTDSALLAKDHGSFANHHPCEGRAAWPLSWRHHDRHSCPQPCHLGAWMCVLLHFWPDHSTAHLFGGQIIRQSVLSEIILRDLNPWMPRVDRFSWNMVAREAATLLGIRDQYTEQHHKEWWAQK